MTKRKNHVKITIIIQLKNVYIYLQVHILKINNIKIPNKSKTFQFGDIIPTQKKKKKKRQNFVIVTKDMIKQHIQEPPLPIQKYVVAQSKIVRQFLVSHSSIEYAICYKIYICTYT